MPPSVETGNVLVANYPEMPPWCVKSWGWLCVKLVASVVPHCPQIPPSLKLGGIFGAKLPTNPAHKCYNYQCKMSKVKSVKGIHSFDGEESPAYKSMVQWHPCITKRASPTWLHDYYIVCFVGAASLSDVGHLVHSLYHSQFDEYSDLQSMLPALHKGETIAVLNREKTDAISAITLMAQSNSAVVLFLATSTDYSSLGMASFCFPCRTKQSEGGGGRQQFTCI